MSMPVSLQDVVEELYLSFEGLAAYIHKPSGRVVVVERELLRMVEEGRIPVEDDEDVDETVVIDSSADDEPDELSHCIGIVKTGDYVAFPSKRELDDWNIMAEFVRAQPPGSTRSRLEEAILGSGAFSRFRRVVEQSGWQDRWYAYRDAAYKTFAEGWLQSLGIDYVDEGQRRGEH